LPSTCLRSIGRKMYHLCFRDFGRTFLARMPDTSRSTMRQGPTNTCQQRMTDTEQYHCCLHSQRMSPYRSRGTFQLRQPPPTTNTYPPHMRCRRLATWLQPRTSISQPRNSRMLGLKQPRPRSKKSQADTPRTCLMKQPHELSKICPHRMPHTSPVTSLQERKRMSPPSTLRTYPVKLPPTHSKTCPLHRYRTWSSSCSTHIYRPRTRDMLSLIRRPLLWNTCPPDTWRT
jgi:hypothetical protein